MTNGNAERSRVATIAVIAAAWTVLAFVFGAQDYVLARYAGQPMSAMRVITGVAPHYVIWALLAMPIAALAARFSIERPFIGRRLLLHAVFCVVAYAAEIAISLAIVPRLLADDPNMTPFLFGFAAIRTFYDDFLLYAGIVGVSHLLRYQKRLVMERARRAELERQFAVAQLNALRAQLQPHFLFNTLNSISELMHIDVDAADRMTDALSSLLRSSLECEEQQIVLSRELAMLDVYLEIQQVRFSDSVTIERSVDSAVLDALVPTLFLQPIVENAFKHGMSRSRQQGLVTVSAARTETMLRVEVRDNGSGVAQTNGREGIGLRNTRDRLEQLYGSDQSLSLDAIESGGMCVTVMIPFRTATEARS
jgi:sensor histidine kinase YesM